MGYINRYGAIKSNIVDELQLYEDKYFTTDDPVPFCNLLLYPITVRNYNEFLNANLCLTLNKNESVEGLKKTNLEFLLDKMSEEEEGVLWSYRFSRLIEMVFHLSNGLKCSECGQIISYAEYSQKIEKFEGKQEEKVDKTILNCACGASPDKFYQVIKYGTDEKTKKKYLLIDNQKIGSADFDRFRQIVLFQNLPDYYDETGIDPDLKKDHEDKLALTSKNGVKASTEQKIVAVSLTSNYRIAEIVDLPIRKFLIMLSMADDIMQYQATRVGLMTGMVSMKTPPEHWLYKKDKDIYGNDYVNVNEIQSKIEGM